MADEATMQPILGPETFAINRGPWTALVDDDGSNTIGTPWNKAAIATVILDPVDAALAALAPPAPTILALLNAAGSDTTAGAAAMSIANVSGLLPYHTVQVEIECHCIPAVVPGLLLVCYQSAVSTVLVALDPLVPGSTVLSARVALRRSSPATGDSGIFSHLTVRGNTAGAVGGGLATGMSWAAPWQLVFQHNGVPAGSTLHWIWSVSRVGTGLAGLRAEGQGGSDGKWVTGEELGRVGSGS